MNKNQWLVFAIISFIAGGVLKIVGYINLDIYIGVIGWIIVWIGIACVICGFLEKKK